MVTDVQHDAYVDNLYSISQAIRVLEQSRDDLVIEARQAGVAWQSIAAALGITRQGAQQRYARAVPDPAQMELVDAEAYRAAHADQDRL